jgi:hypothetical protein
MVRILVEFEKVNTRFEFEDLIEMLDSIEQKYSVVKAPKEWIKEDVACGLVNSSIPRKDKSLAYP